MCVLRQMHLVSIRVFQVRQFVKLDGSHTLLKQCNCIILSLQLSHYPSAVFMFSIIGCIFILVVGGYLGNGTIGPIPRSLQLGLSRGVSTQVSWCFCYCRQLQSWYIVYRFFLSLTTTTHPWNTSLHCVQLLLDLTNCSVIYWQGNLSCLQLDSLRIVTNLWISAYHHPQTCSHCFVSLVSTW